MAQRAFFLSTYLHDRRPSTRGGRGRVKRFDPELLEVLMEVLAVGVDGLIVNEIKAENGPALC